MGLLDGLLIGALATVFAVWLLASVPNQFRWQWWEWIARRDARALLPRSTFFAPRPGRHDLHILIRDWLGDTPPGPWCELERRQPSLWLRAFWNPGRFERKAVTDVGNALVRAATRRDPGPPQTGPPGRRLDVVFVSFDHPLP